MRRFDKQKKIAKANLISELRYLSLKGLLTEDNLEINKNNLTDESTKLVVRPDVHENVGTFKLEFKTDENGEFANVYLREEGFNKFELCKDIKAMKDGNTWVFGNWDWSITRENTNPYVALAELVYTIF